MTRRLVQHLAKQSVEDLRIIYRSVRLDIKQPDETSDEFDTYVLDRARQDNCLQLERKIVNRAIACTYIALTMLRDKPECKNCSTIEGVDKWLDFVAYYFNSNRAYTRLIVYNSVCELRDMA